MQWDFGPKRTKVEEVVAKPLGQVYPTIPCILSLLPKNDFTLSPHCAATKVFLKGIMRSPPTPLPPEKLTGLAGGGPRLIDLLGAFNGVGIRFT